jgi:hypothetical protein
MQENSQAVRLCSLGLDLATKWKIDEEKVVELNL